MPMFTPIVYSNVYTFNRHSLKVAMNLFGLTYYSLLSERITISDIVSLANSVGGCRSSRKESITTKIEATVANKVVVI